VIPSRIGEYRVLSRLGAGGMGEVLLAEDDRLQRRVAIKRLLSASGEDSNACRRLLIEARAAARLDHPNICAIYEVGEDAGPFIVMPVIDGQTLASLLAGGALPIVQAVSIAAQVADALAAAHAQGVLHRDIKPANLMIDARGQVRVMDFGVARVEETAGRQTAAHTVGPLTTPGTTVGTVSYMSPEQARGEHVDARSDLFNLGVVLYEMVAGCRPFDRRTAVDAMAATLFEEPPPLTGVRPDAPEELQRIISKTLRKSREERFASAADLHVDLQNLLRSLQSATHTAQTRPVAASPWTSRRLAIAGGLAVLALAAVAGIGVLTSRFAARQTTSVGGTIEIDSLAVLPLVNNSGNADKEFVSDGITESLIGSLSLLPNLRVVSRNTVFMFKGKTADAQKIAKQLGVAAVMTGTISKADDQLVIDIELSGAKDASVILSRRYLQPAARAPSMESDIAQDVARNLQMKLTGDAQRQLAKPPTANADAYQLFLKGRFFYNRQTPQSLHEAITYYRQAIALDPSYAQAYVGAAESYLDLGSFFESPKETMPLAKTYANRGLEADPASVDARIVLGLISLIYDWDWAAAARATTTKSGTMLPRAIGMFSCAAHLLESTGHHAQADSELRHALAEDPLSVPMNTEVGCNAYYARRYDEAVRGYREALSLDAGNVVALWGLGRTLNQQKKYAEATAELATVDAADASQPLIIAETAYGYAASGRTADARALLEKLNAMSKGTFVDPYLVATVYIGLDDKTRALESLEKAYEAKSSFMVSLAGEPKWDGIRSDPRFKDLVKRVGF
jgi:serine/threonine protein kinase/tetratricopeptide (TPR) repeat protein